jgi:hypothetical protein
MAQVQDHEEAPSVLRARVGEYVAICPHGRVRANGQRGLGAAQREEATMEGEHGRWISALGRHVCCSVIFGEGKPQFDAIRTETGVLGPVPLHRGARGVAAEALPGDVLLEGVLHHLGRYLHVAHPQLVPVVEGGRAAQREEEHGGDAGCASPTLLAMRERSWLPSTQLGQAPGGRAAS